MTNALIIGAALAVMTGCGYGVQSFLAGSSRSFNLAEQAALSWLFGAGVISMLIWLGGFVFKGGILPGFVLVVALWFSYIGWRRRERISIRRFDKTEFFLLLLIVAEVCVVFYLSFTHTLGWDGVFNWELKARYAFASNGVLPAALFHDSGRRFTHQEYPVCIPFTELWLYFWLGEANQLCAKLIFPLFYCAGVLLLAALVARFSGRRWLGLAAAGMMFFVPQITVRNGGAIFGYADFPLGIVYLAAIGLLVRAATEDSAACWRAFAFCLALLPWMKREGLVLWAVAASCGAIVILRTKKSRAAFFALTPGLLVAVAWACYLRAMHLAASSEFLPPNLSTLRSHLDRLLPIVHIFASEFYNLSTWGVLWFAVVFACLSLLRRIREIRSAILLLALFVPVAIYLPVFTLSNWPNYLLHVYLSLSRLLLHVAPLGLCIAGVAAARVAHPSSLRARTCVGCDRERTPAVEFA